MHLCLKCLTEKKCLEHCQNYSCSALITVGKKRLKFCFCIFIFIFFFFSFSPSEVKFYIVLTTVRPCGMDYMWNMSPKINSLLSNVLPLREEGVDGDSY